MYRVVTEIWTLNVVAQKHLLEFLRKKKNGHNLHYMQDRVIILDYLHRCDGWKGLYKDSMQCIK